MHPPQYVLKELQDIHPWLRLGWVGESDDTGSFFLLQLLHKRASQIEFNEPWEQRGPVYGKPYDLLRRVPYIMAGPFKMSRFRDAQGETYWTWGSLVKTVRRLLTPAYERTVESAKQYNNEVDNQIHDLACEMGSRLYHQAHQTGSAQRRDLAKKFVTKEDKEILTGDKLAEMKEVGKKMPRRTI